MANDYKAVIMKNKPEDGAAGQYNYGTVDDSDGIEIKKTLLGTERGNMANELTSLYTIVDSYTTSITPDGILWNCNGSKLEIEELHVGIWPDGNDWPESDGGSYPDTQIAIYIFDDEITPAIKNVTNGNEIRDIIGTGNSFKAMDNTIGTRWIGNATQDQHIGTAVATTGNWSNELEIYDFPFRATGPPAKITSEIFESDKERWTKTLTGQKSDSNLWIVVRVGSNEREKISKNEIDERDRAYALLKIPKEDLYANWKLQTGLDQSFTFGVSLPDSIQGQHEWYRDHNYRDNFGDTRGHKNWTINSYRPIFGISKIKVKITAPTWTPASANKTEDDGGNYSGWANNLDPGLINFSPEHNIDFHNFPAAFYGENNYFNTSLIYDFRPISFISSRGPYSFQNYYEKGTEPDSDTAAPTSVLLTFRLANNLDNFNIPYNDSLIDGDIGYAFFVANWNWQDGDPKTLLEVAETIPIKEEVLTAKKMNENTFDLKIIGAAGNDTAEHTYNIPGLKIIKAIVFSYIQGVDLSYQALRWKLATIRISLSSSRAFIKDFVELGGIDYITIPDPGIIQPIIGGLSSESVYIQSLKAVKRLNQFGEQEIQEKNQIATALENSPGRTVDELGNHLGQANIAQVRFLKTPKDLSEMLIIDPLITNTNGTEFYPHTDSSYWNGENNKFPLQSPVGEIFISEYTDLQEHCLIELNCGSLDGTTIRDSSGRGNKGILIGDFSIRKDEVNRPTVRDSFVDLPKTDSKDGAF